ncbi:MAG: PAS domain-containing protein [Deltaproteobacteria bacterium]|nr:PAS domain-containing protein [Deltaproteobacteria bacterium]
MKLSISAKIFTGFTLLLGIFAVLAYFSIREIRSVAADHLSIKEGQLAIARLAAQIETHQENRFRDIRRVLAGPYPRRQEILRAGLTYYPAVIRARIDDVRTLCARHAPMHGVATPSNARARFCEQVVRRVDGIETLHGQLDDISAQVLARLAENASTDGLEAQVDRVEDALRAATFQLNKQINDETDRAVQNAQREERAAIWRVVAMTIVALIIGLVLTVLSARTLAPIGRLVRYARAISRGDYHQPIPSASDRDLASLAEVLHQMGRSRQEREDELDRQANELEQAYRRVADLKRYHESVVRSLRTAVVATDRDLRVTSVNRAAETNFGLSPPSTRGSNIEELAIGPPLVERLGPLSALVERNRDVVLSAVPIGELLVDVRIARLESDSGDVLGLVIALEDVTEPIRTKEALIRSERLAAIGRMSAHVTHEIRNPLSSIGLNAELLQDLVAQPDHTHGQREEATTLCQAIGREVDRLAAITEEYLRFARFPQPQLRDEDLGALIASVAAFVRRDCEAVRVELVTEIPDGIPPVRIDADQIRQALLNLVRNAKESMTNGGRLALHLERSGDQTAVVVTDSGAGIPKDKLDRIFDPFYSTKLTGTGLGLALCHQIVVEHGAQLRVTSELGQGSEFRIVFPDFPGSGSPRVGSADADGAAHHANIAG